ncbi:Calcium/calmodulin-dependent serine/threonine-protein kinase 1 [Triticum urartu]|uniref:Calcium/calmodulin-dependent serine/threonine-protein kinase 1 n=1 Tax=Triticum urartu TaxID=4572 RepID=M7ZJX8_TRIUA|nr:Calcium/calmodulin-dependent serine/threonine-protein kinase 1 [Triticum urartu]
MPFGPAHERALGGRGLDKGFGFNKGFAAKYDLGDEVGRGHFGYTCAARIRKGARKGDAVAVKLIPKAKEILNIRIAKLAFHAKESPIRTRDEVFNLVSS